MLRRVLIWASLLLGIAGCQRGPEMHEVHGRATWEGQPIAAGDIVLLPVDPTVHADAGKIVDGGFQFMSRPGKKRVQIFASREGKYSAAMKTVGRESYIPPQFNHQTKLTAEVSAGDNDWNFDLRAAD